MKCLKNEYIYSIIIFHQYKGGESKMIRYIEKRQVKWNRISKIIGTAVFVVLIAIAYVATK